jgi:hypothetical protein
VQLVERFTVWAPARDQVESDSALQGVEPVQLWRIVNNLWRQRLIVLNLRLVEVAHHNFKSTRSLDKQILSFVTERPALTL